MSNRFVTPKTYFMSYTEINEPELIRYLRETGQMEFLQAYDQAREDDKLSSAEILCSFFAKLCYRSLAPGKNLNLTKTRNVWDNIVATFDSGHGAVFEHVNFGFVVSDCSRVYTHEQVRHRIAAYSQTSGRYVRLEHIPVVLDPILDPVKDIINETVGQIEDAIYLMECKLGLRVPPPWCPDIPAEALLDPSMLYYGKDDVGRTFNETWRAKATWARSAADPEWAKHADPEEASRWVPNDKMPFHEKKKLTSAIRRIAPNGIANELGFTVNLRTLRHQMMVRTAAAAEWEIRLIFNQIHDLLASKYPLIFYGEKKKFVDGAWEYTGYKVQPYEKEALDVLGLMTDEEILGYLDNRRLAS